MHRLAERRMHVATRSSIRAIINRGIPPRPPTPRPFRALAKREPPPPLAIEASLGELRAAHAPPLVFIGSLPPPRSLILFTVKAARLPPPSRKRHRHSLPPSSEEHAALLPLYRVLQRLTREVGHGPIYRTLSASRTRAGYLSLALCKLVYCCTVRIAVNRTYALWLFVDI